MSISGDRTLGALLDGSGDDHMSTTSDAAMQDDVWSFFPFFGPTLGTLE